MWSNIGPDLAQILAGAGQFAQSVLNTESLIQWKRLNAEPRMPLLAKQTGGGAPLDQMCGRTGGVRISVFKAG
ncbi:hypothetical protein G3N96_01230 [Burkholderia sp. Se-20373]|uniref:hypothetical protein n=1 Tax=Burkholderia sp. Se-20373 TaxID=2703898 RepID=UPI00197E2C8A|nr:hypothetical protein [Burkholderia sp. Se-20373]MBN3744075.1 hypothetical protein [Burkholderia sp. Se-20373]